MKKLLRLRPAYRHVTQSASKIAEAMNVPLPDRSYVVLRCRSSQPFPYRRMLSAPEKTGGGEQGGEMAEHGRHLDNLFCRSRPH